MEPAQARHTFLDTLYLSRNAEVSASTREIDEVSPAISSNAKKSTPKPITAPEPPGNCAIPWGRTKNIIAMVLAWGTTEKTNNSANTRPVRRRTRIRS